MRRLRVIVLIVAATGAFLLTGSKLWGQAGTSTTVPNIPQVTSREATMNGRQVGQVLVGDNVVMQFSQPAGGYSAQQRASVVAGRLSTLLGMGYTWNNVQVGRMGNEVVLLMGNHLLTTVDSRTARLNGTTPLNLAYTWQNQTQVALRNAATSAVAGTREEWPAWTNPTTKIVPIISIGTPGAALGAAQVTGPQELVNNVKSVVQLQALFRRTADVYIFVPSSNLTGLNRVQGVAVTALLNYQLVKL